MLCSPGTRRAQRGRVLRTGSAARQTPWPRADTTTPRGSSVLLTTGDGWRPGGLGSYRDPWLCVPASRRVCPWQRLHPWYVVVTSSLDGPRRDRNEKSVLPVRQPRRDAATPRCRDAPTSHRLLRCASSRPYSLRPSPGRSRAISAVGARSDEAAACRLRPRPIRLPELPDSRPTAGDRGSRPAGGRCGSCPGCRQTGRAPRRRTRGTRSRRPGRSPRAYRAGGCARGRCAPG